jgi:hypothetical protein
VSKSRSIGVFECGLIVVMFASMLASAGCPRLAFGQSVTLPAEVRGAPGAWIIVAPEAVDGGQPKWQVDPALQEVRLDLLLPPETIASLRGKVLTCSTPGRFRVLAWNAKGDVASNLAECWVVIVDPRPPTPPPDPPQPPDPTPGPTPPVPAGARAVLILRETAESTPQLARLLTQLRTGQHAEYLRSKGHSLSILDDDAVGSDGRPSPAVELWRPHFAGLTLPAVLIYDPTSKVVIAKQSLPATSAEVIETLKRHGG